MYRLPLMYIHLVSQNFKPSRIINLAQVKMFMAGLGYSKGTTKPHCLLTTNWPCNTLSLILFLLDFSALNWYLNLNFILPSDVYAPEKCHSWPKDNVLILCQEHQYKYASKILHTWRSNIITRNTPFKRPDTLHPYWVKIGQYQQSKAIHQLDQKRNSRLNTGWWRMLCIILSGAASIRVRPYITSSNFKAF
jgi:hypothetical protein